MCSTKKILTPLILAFTLMSCGQQTEEKSALFLGRPGDSVGLDPARETDGESLTVASEIYEGLVGFAGESVEIEPVLAESYEISDDAQTFTFQLRQGVKFHDDTDFNADAVVFAFERQFKEDNPGNPYGPWKFWGYMNFDNVIDSVTATGEYEVVIQLKKPTASFLATLAMHFMYIPSPTAALKYKDDFTNHPVGTGAYKFVSWQKNDNITLEAFDNYWGDRAKIQNVVFRVIPDPTARTLALQNGEIDAFTYPSPNDVNSLRADENIELFEASGLNVGYMAMNVEKQPFDDMRVRKAINYAVNKEDVVKTAYGEMGQRADSPLPPIMWAYKPNLQTYEYNPERAKELLAEAGLADGFETEILVLPVTRPYMPQGAKVAEIVQQQLAEVGIRAKLTTLEWGTHLERTDQGDYEMGFLGWSGDNGDPDNFLGLLLAADRAVVPASNIAFWKNEEFTDLITRANQISDQEQRKDLYFQAQDIFAAEVPWVTIANSRVIVPYKKAVKNLHYNQVAVSFRAKDIYIE